MGIDSYFFKREKDLNYLQDDSQMDCIARIYGAASYWDLHSMVMNNAIYEGTLAISLDPNCESKSLSCKDEYDMYNYWGFIYGDAQFGVDRWQYAYRVEKPFFDELKESKVFMKLKSDKYGRHNTFEAECLDDEINELDFEHYDYYVYFSGNPDT